MFKNDAFSVEAEIKRRSEAGDIVNPNICRNRPVYDESTGRDNRWVKLQAFDWSSQFISPTIDFSLVAGYFDKKDFSVPDSDVMRIIETNIPNSHWFTGL